MDPLALPTDLRFTRLKPIEIRDLRNFIESQVTEDEDTEAVGEQLEAIEGLGEISADRLREHIVQSEPETVANVAGISEEEAEELIKKAQTKS